MGYRFFDTTYRRQCLWNGVSILWYNVPMSMSLDLNSCPIRPTWRGSLNCCRPKYCLKVLVNVDTLLRTHCCRHKCFPVCPRAQHLLRTQILCPGHKKCFWFWSETFCVRNECFPVCATCDTSWATMSATMCPRLPVPLRSFHWNRTCTEIFVKICLLIVYIIRT